MARLTRREFLKLAGAVAATGTASTLVDLGAPRSAGAEAAAEFDGREMVAKVGDTFASIQLVPRFTKSAEPAPVVTKVQYGTDPALATYQESPEVVASSCTWRIDGTHVGPDGSRNLLVSRRCKLLSWDWEIAPGDLILNETDRSTMSVTSLLDDQTVAGTLSGGSRNCWNSGDKWVLNRTYYWIENKLTGLSPSTKYYYRVVVMPPEGGWQAPRSIHSFWTRRPRGETFRFAIWADPHRDIVKSELKRRHWEEWSTLVENVRRENADFLMDVGDTWTLARGSGRPGSKYLPALYSMVMRPTRNGPGGYQGVADLCADCGYYMARGNHEGLNDYDSPYEKKLLSTLLKLFVPNPSGATYPQGGSDDDDYDQGYFAFEWGDALFIVLDAVKYKEPKLKLRSPERFHIGQKQLEWLTSTLQQSSARWKLIFVHHLFGGGNYYARGGAAFAFDYENAQLQALAEQYGAHIFKGHDHLLAEEYAHGVLYYCCGLAWGIQFNYSAKNGLDTFYPQGFTATSCRSDPPTCANNGYCVVEVSPTRVKIQYKSYQGNLIRETTLSAAA